MCKKFISLLLSLTILLGAVWVPAGAAREPGQFLLSERQGERGPVLRLLCDTPPADGVPVTPGLEDAFLAIYREGAA